MELFREHFRPVVSENIEAVHELIIQERQVTCRDIEASLGISSTSIQSIFPEHMAVKMNCSRWFPQNLTNAQKKVRVDWCKEMLVKTQWRCLKRHL